MWRAIRWGMDGKLIDLDRGEAVPARARLEQILEDVAEISRELGIEPHLRPLEGPSPSQRYIAMLEDGATPRELWPAVVARTHESAAEWLAVRQAP